MYAKEMRRNSVGRDYEEDGGGGGGDDTGGGGDGDMGVGKFRSQNGSSDSHDQDLSLNYGNYGDPYSFAPYQLLLLALDFVFNWSIDLAHEYPLAVLVIFIFQSLAIMVNLILYIMSSASQAMQVGLQRRITVHHWLNLLVCLLYTTLTGWWFIWALRKSWPSVSDQFSFTWPATDLGELRSAQQQLNASAKNATKSSRLTSLNSNSNSTYFKSPPGPHQALEHDPLWTPGFNAVYVIQRTVAILYYFIYLRSTFLLLNTPAMDKFEDMKQGLDLNLEGTEEEEHHPKVGGGGEQRRRRKRRLTSSVSFPADASGARLGFGFDEQLSEDAGFILENEGRGTGRRKGRKQIIWADDEGLDQGGGHLGGTGKYDGGHREEDGDDVRTDPNENVVENVERRNAKRRNKNSRRGETRRTAEVDGMEEQVGETMGVGVREVDSKSMSKSRPVPQPREKKTRRRPVDRDSN